MLSVTFNGNPAWLLDDQPTWVDGVAVDAELPVSYERGISGRETRRPTGDTLRLTLKWNALITTAAALTTLRNSLQAMTVEPVLCPFWPGLTLPGATPACTTQYYVLLDDTAAPSIQPASAAPFARNSYPLLVGYLKTPPDPALLNDVLAAPQFEFTESDASSLTPPAFAGTNSLSDASGARPLFPFAPDWTAFTSGDSEADVARQQIGALRALQSQYFTQRSRRKSKQAFTLTTPLNLLGFFVACGGETKSFWLPAGISEAALTANVAATDTVLNVDNPGALGGNVFVALNDNNHVAPLKISGVTGNQWNLTAAPGVAFGANTTRIETLWLARFDALKLSLVFVRPDLAHADIQFKELPWEPAAVAGETIGTTMGALPATAILYKFTLTIPTAPQVWYFTGFERNLGDGANTWISAPLEFNEIMETDNLERQSVTLKARNFSGNPLALIIPFQLEFPLLVEIYEGDVAGNVVSNLRCYFAGEVGKVDAEPPFLTADCVAMASIFNRNIPRRLYQPNCNWVLFEPNCGLLPANWTWTGVVVNYSATASTIVVNTLASSNATAIVAHFFAAGYLGVTTNGVTSYRMMGDNSALAGGQITIYLAQPLVTPPNVGDAVTLLPGCDGLCSTCLNTFNNYAKFGAFPFIPVGNPTVFQQPQSNGSSKK